jgi:hypothetical protein
VKINTSKDRPHGTIHFESENDGLHTYEWELYGSSYPEIIIAPSAASKDVVSQCKQAKYGSHELLSLISNRKVLQIRNTALNRVDCCSCKAAAVFESDIRCMSAWSESSAQPGDQASSSPKVAVGFEDGTIHFMELHGNDAIKKPSDDIMCRELESEISTAGSQRDFEQVHRAVLPSYFDLDPDSEYIELSKSMLAGFQGDPEKIESLARFLEFNKLSLEALIQTTGVEESKLQEILLNEKVINNKEDGMPSGYQFRLDLFQGTPEVSSLRSGSLCYNSINPVLCQVVLLFARGKTWINLVEFLKSQPSKLWFSCVFIPNGDRDKVIVFEVDASHTETMMHFEKEYVDHFKGQIYFFWPLVLRRGERTTSIVPGQRSRKRRQHLGYYDKIKDPTGVQAFDGDLQALGE